MADSGHWEGGTSSHGLQLYWVLDPAPIETPAPPYISALPGPTAPTMPREPPPLPVLDVNSSTWGQAIPEGFGTRRVTGALIWVSKPRRGDVPPLLTGAASPGTSGLTGAPVPDQPWYTVDDSELGIGTNSEGFGGFSENFSGATL
jgi:hypothetical protein